MLPLPAELEAAHAAAHALVERAEREGKPLPASSGFAALNARAVRTILEGRRYRARGYHFDGYVDFHRDRTLYLRAPRLIVPGRWRVEHSMLCMTPRALDICGPLFSNGTVLLTSQDGRVSSLGLSLLSSEPLAEE
ncbi:hypothetical protein G3545_10255 [Starkeya sp. ORNL1]|uniref:hypothetical protein n=1 Tax=Starkeya sp. ORNL1 TaxID=2709380 RepID=UPI00146418B8|nr:hypothetical protein [Starkeya sp. ORNL1]QJP13995.1 hypothetical protein G3545_10255 [Starkeya sp. ORNL1]